MKKLVVALLCGAFALTASALPAGASATGQAQVAKKKCKKAKKGAVAAKKKCKKKKPPATVPPPTTSPTVPTGSLDTDGDGVPDSSDNCVSAANSDQSDTDADGKGDVCDYCPATPNPGTAGCPVSIYDINQGNVPNGTNVRLVEKAVTATMGDLSAIWLQVNSNDNDFVGSGNAGLEVDLSGLASPPTISVGDRVTIDGIVGTQSLAATNVAINSGGTAPEPASITPVNFASGAFNSSFNGQFTGINGQTTFSGLTVDNEWTTSHGFVVGKRIIGTLPNCAAGSALGLFGIADLVNGNLVLLPRSNADITCVRLALDAQVCDTAGSGPIGTVNLGYPVAAPTTVSMVSGTPSKLTVSDTVVPTGFSSASVNGTPISDGTVSVTATLNGISNSDTIDVVGAPFC